MTGRHTIAAAVCTRGRPVQLRRALFSLIGQSDHPDEILTIDNAPPDQSTNHLVREEFRGVRYIREDLAGLDFARNRALREARSDIVAFLDDDAVAAQSWAASIQQVFDNNPLVAACTGRVDALELRTEAQRLFEANGGFSRGAQTVRLPQDAGNPLHGFGAPLIAWAVSVGNGASLAVRRRCVLELGGFDEALDLGPEMPGGGDLDLLWRVLKAGFEVLYEPQVQAWHEHRRELPEVFIQLAGHQLALTTFLSKEVFASAGSMRVSVLAFLIWRLCKPGVRLLRKALGNDPLPARLLLSMWANCWRGLFSYPKARKLARQRRADLSSMNSDG